jgi:hypothetical protein
VKTGKVVGYLSLLFSIGFALGKINSKSYNSIKEKNKQGATNQQYANRLIEFFDEDLSYAISEYCEYLEMGFNPSDAFDIAKAKAKL